METRDETTNYNHLVGSVLTATYKPDESPAIECASTIGIVTGIDHAPSGDQLIVTWTLHRKEVFVGRVVASTVRKQGERGIGVYLA